MSIDDSSAVLRLGLTEAGDAVLLPVVRRAVVLAVAGAPPIVRAYARSLALQLSDRFPGEPVRITADGWLTMNGAEVVALGRRAPPGAVRLAFHSAPRALLRWASSDRTEFIRCALTSSAMAAMSGRTTFTEENDGVPANSTLIS